MKKRTLLLITALTISVFASACGGKTEETAVEDTEAVMETEAVAEAEEPETEEEEVIETEEPETEAEEVTETEEPVTADEEETAGFSVTDLSATMYASGSVAVRKGPSTDYDRIGALSVNQKVTVTGQADSGWYRIEYQGEEAYVSNKYLSDKETVNNTASAGTAATAGTEAAGSSVASQGTTSQETASQGTSSAGNTTAAPSGSTSTAGTTTPAQTATETTAGSAPAQDSSSAQNTPSVDNSNTSGRADIDWNNPDEVLEYFEQTKDQVERVGGYFEMAGVTYVAVDGTEFSTSEECDEYERYLESIGYWD